MSEAIALIPSLRRMTMLVALEDFKAVGFDPRSVKPDLAPDAGPAISAALEYAYKNFAVVRANNHHYAVRTPIKALVQKHQTLLSSGSRLPWGLDLGHATLHSRVPNGTPTISIGAAVDTRHLQLLRFSVRGGTGPAIYLYAREYAGTVAPGCLYLPRMAEITVEGAMGSGIWIRGEVYEGSIFGCSVRDTLAVSGSGGEGLRIQNGDADGVGIVSSILVDSCNLSMNAGDGALIRRPTCDVRFRGCDFISNKRAGINYGNGTTSDSVEGCHFENNWDGSVPSVSLSHVQAQNGLTVRNCSGRRNTGGAQSLLGMYVSIPSALQQCFVQGPGMVLCNVNGAAGASFEIDGCLGTVGKIAMPWMLNGVKQAPI